MEKMNEQFQIYESTSMLSKSFFLNLVQILKYMSKDEFQIWNGYKYIALLKKEQVEKECYGFWKWIWLEKWFPLQGERGRSS